MNKTEITKEADLILGPFRDMLESGEVVDFMLHSKIDLDDIERCHGDVTKLECLILDAFKVDGKPGQYNLSNAAHCLASYPPIAARIKELQAQQRKGKAKKKRKPR